MRRVLLFVLLATALSLTFVGAAHAASVTRVVQVDALNTQVFMSTSAEYLSSPCTVRVRTAGGTLYKTTAATMKREIKSKSWDGEGYVYTYGDWYACVRLDSATMAAWRAGTYQVYLSFWEGSTKVNELLAARGPDVAVTVTPQQSSVTPGGDANFVVTVTNVGGVPATVQCQANILRLSGFMNSGFSMASYGLINAPGWVPDWGDGDWIFKANSTTPVPPGASATFACDLIRAPNSGTAGVDAEVICAGDIDPTNNTAAASIPIVP